LAARTVYTRAARAAVHAVKRPATAAGIGRGSVGAGPASIRAAVAAAPILNTGAAVLNTRTSSIARVRSIEVAGIGAIGCVVAAELICASAIEILLSRFSAPAELLARLCRLRRIARPAKLLRSLLIAIRHALPMARVVLPARASALARLAICLPVGLAILNVLLIFGAIDVAVEFGVAIDVDVDVVIPPITIPPGISPRGPAGYAHSD
jgi:hypothetical protein